MRFGKAKQYYLSQDVIDWIAKKADEDGRNQSNYLTVLIRRLAREELKRAET